MNGQPGGDFVMNGQAGLNAGGASPEGGAPGMAPGGGSNYLSAEVMGPQSMTDLGGHITYIYGACDAVARGANGEVVLEY